MPEVLEPTIQDYERHIADISALLAPQDPDLVDIEEADQIYMEKETERLRKKIELKANPPIRPFDLSINGIMSFRQSKLQMIYDGTQNITIPVQMLAKMNGDEILAIYYGTADMKKDNKHIGEKLSFLEWVSKMNNRAYPAIGRPASMWKRRFPNKPGDEVKRLGDLGEAVKEQFTKSCLKPRVIVPETYEAGIKVYGHLQSRQIEVLLQ